MCKVKVILQNCIVYMLFFLFYINSNAQSKITGVVVDKSHKQPIAFVNISLPGTVKGTTTDIDGSFEITIPKNYSGNIVFSHVSYKKEQFSIQQLTNSRVVHLKRQITNLNELVFIADENPAHRIIRNAIANKKKNDPNKLKSYYYKSYNKEVFKMDVNQFRLDSLSILLTNIDSFQLTRSDSSQFRLDTISNNQHVMLIESVAETKFTTPGIQEETVLATKISGLNSPLFASTGSQYRSFGFYEDVIKVMDNEYINPLINTGLKMYDYYIVDTSFYEMDTVYSISFEPKKGKRFEALTGVISICVNGYAIKNVVAQTADVNSTIEMRIQQLYERIDDVFFPVQLNTDITFKENPILKTGFKMEGKSYLTEINMEANLTKKEFSDVSFIIPRIDDEENVKVLNEHRFKPLDSIDIKTYEVWDTLAYKIDRYIKIVEFLAIERIPIGFIDIKFNDLIRMNQYEIIRLGIGGATNSKLLKWASIGGYIAYGFGDNQIKYGGNLNIRMNKRQSTTLSASYSYDIEEVGRTQFFNAERILNEESLRNLQASRFDFAEKLGVELKSRILPFTYVSIQLSNELRQPTYLYAYQKENREVIGNFNITEASVAFRYVNNERYFRFLDIKLFPQNDFPIIKAKFTKGIGKFMDSDFDYERYDFLFVHKKTSRLGKTGMYLRGSLINGEFPYGKGIVGWGNKNAYTNVPNYFQTMGLYEFLSDKAIGLFLNHNFGNVFWATKKSKPEMVIYHNIAIGELERPEHHLAIGFDTMEDGYFESGLGFRNLFRFNYLELFYIGFGGDAFYRYGSYGFSEIADNFAFTFNVDFTF